LTSSQQIGYVAGYYKYWGNNTDRIDFCGTEAHPRDFDNSLWHGYVKDGMVYNSTGQVIDSSLKDVDPNTTNSKDISDFTQVFKTGSTLGPVALTHAWNLDVVRYDDGTIAILGQARAQGTCGTEAGYGNTNCDPDKRLLYFRFDGTSWKGTYLVKAGPKLYFTEEDYTGGGALDPDDPNTIFISSTFDPRDDTTQTPKHEIYQGTTCDHGATWTWTPITHDSTVDNIRPIVPKWDAKHTALAWMKGTYTSAQSYTMQIVGLVSPASPASEVDAAGAGADASRADDDATLDAADGGADASRADGNATPEVGDSSDGGGDDPTEAAPSNDAGDGASSTADDAASSTTD
jgi:hypothetical protein